MIIITDLLAIPFGQRIVGWWGNSYGNQVPVKTFGDIVKIIDEHQSLDNIGISMCTFKDNKPYLLFLPFDFDSNDLKEAWKDAIKLYNYLIKRDYDVHITYSGRRGFHIFLATEPKWYHKNQIKSVQKYFKKELDLKTLDSHIFGDIRRLMRIPHTYNIRGNLCREITKHDGKLLDLDLLAIEDVDMRENVEYDEVDYHSYPCIEYLVREDNEPRHIIRFTYVILRLADGWTEDDIIDEIQEEFNWIDWDESYTRNQIRHIEERGYVPPSCKTLIDTGFCPKHICPCSEISSEKRLEEVGIK